MKARLNAYTVTPEITREATRLQQAIEAAGVEPSLIDLIKVRVSQINGCAFCVNMHTADARKRGESETRLYVLSAWRESTLYTPRERAALTWADTLTHVAERGAPETQYEALKEFFDPMQIVALTSMIAMMNFWNRTAIGLGYVHPSEAAYKHV